jgi:O-antigen/teichoic acid export membrane protein
LLWKGPRELGQYAAAVRLAELLSLFPLFFMQSAFPVISSAAMQADKTPLRISASCFRYLFLLSFPPIFLGMIFAPQVIGLLYGPAYSKAALAFPWLLLAELPVIAGVVYGHFSIAANLQRFDVLLTFVNALTNVVLCVLLIPTAGLAGAAIASLVGYSISYPVQLLFKSTRPYSLVVFREGLRLLAAVAPACIGFLLIERFLPIPAALAISSILLFAFAIRTKLIRPEDSRVFLEIVEARRRG